MRRLALAPLLALTLAACGGNDDLGSADAQRDCEEGATSSAAAKALTDAQKKSYCECLLPKLDAAGLKNSDDLEKAIEDKPEVGNAVRDCALEHLITDK
jgi:hypothetical protein